MLEYILFILYNMTSRYKLSDFVLLRSLYFCICPLLHYCGLTLGINPLFITIGSFVFRTEFSLIARFFLVFDDVVKLMALTMNWSVTSCPVMSKQSE